VILGIQGEARHCRKELVQRQAWARHRFNFVGLFGAFSSVSLRVFRTFWQHKPVFLMRGAAQPRIFM
jgi:hypothetical protein